MEIIKKNKSVEPWNDNKVISAINKAANRACVYLDDETINTVLASVKRMFNKSHEKTTLAMHPIVIKALRLAGKDKVADAYQEYRDYKNTYAANFEQLKEDADGVLHLGDRENANFDSSLTSTKGSIIRGYLTKSLYKQFFLSKEERELTLRGDIYIHDLRDMIFNSVNCCLFDIETVLKNGFEMSNVGYTEPKSVLSALQVAGDITLVATAQQFGGFTLAELDKVLVPYCRKTYAKAVTDTFIMLDSTEADIPDEKKREIARKHALAVVKRELEQGFQSLELKLNTVPCSRGDFAFTTITFGHFSEDADDLDRTFQKMIGETILEVRMKGHGVNPKPVVFPKLVYLFDKNQYEKIPESKELFRKSVECSSQCMYPDYLSLTGNPEHNVVAQTYLEDGVITSPMGCRAYLTPWKDPETGKHVTIGRCNIGAVSLNLPILVHLAQDYITMQGWWDTTPRMYEDKFFELLEDRMQVIRNFFKKRYEAIANSPASSNPMAFTQGGFYKGFRKPDEKVGDLIQYMTASFGISALNEATILWTGKTLHKDKSFAIKILKFMNDKIQEFKKEDGYLYALYGTPAESLCATQAKQYEELTGDKRFGRYFSNSFHLHVSEDVTPFEKQDEEEELFHLCNGGHIQYVRIDNPTNIKALEAVILRGMKKGFYQGVNFDSAYCENCHTHSTNVMFTCPSCGSGNLSVISRVCGYLGYSNVNGKSRMNDGKLAEIRDRKSM